MSNRNRQDRNRNALGANASRRNFLGAVAIGGLILTPLALVGCGGDSEGDGRSAGGGAKKPKGGRKPKSGGGGGGSATPGKYTCVDASELGSKQTVTVNVGYQGPHVPANDPSLKRNDLGGDDGAKAMSEEGYPNGPNQYGVKWVLNESVMTTDMGGGKVGLDNCIVVLSPVAVEKVAKATNTKVEILNEFYRFEPRAVSVAKKGNITWKNGDPVKHAIAVAGVSPAGAGPGLSTDTMEKGGAIDTQSPGFIMNGYFGVTCSLHNWELGRIFVADHAYVAVTSRDNKGAVSIPNVADGKYELQIWHESKNDAIVKQEIEVKAGSVSFDVSVPKIG